MRITHYNMSVEIPPMEFGNEHDMQIRDVLGQIESLVASNRRYRQGVPNVEKKVRLLMERLKGIVAMRKQ